jgi:hypothetical protein
MTAMKKRKEDAKTEKDYKLTGRTIFENKDVKIENIDIADNDVGKVDPTEDMTADDEDQRDAMFYDKALYA